MMFLFAVLATFGSEYLKHFASRIDKVLDKVVIKKKDDNDDE